MLAALLAVAVWVPAPAVGGVAERLDGTRRELAALADQLVLHAAEAEELRAQAFAADLRVAQASRRATALLGARLTVADALAEAQAAYDAARVELESVAVAAFMGIPGGNPDALAVDAALDASSLAEAGDAVAFAAAIGEAHLATADRVAASRERLDARAATLDSLLEERATALADLERARADLAAALAEHDRVSATLEAARDDLIAVAARLSERRRTAVLGGVGAAFRGAHHVSYGEWAQRFLDALGVPACRNNVVVVVAWQVQESTQAAWNPLATTRRMPGSTDFNWVGVQNFRSLRQGIAATLGTIENGLVVYRYGAIVEDLARCADPLATATSIAASSWCPGCLDGMYVVGLVAKVDADLAAYAAL